MRRILILCFMIFIAVNFTFSQDIKNQIHIFTAETVQTLIKKCDNLDAARFAIITIDLKSDSDKFLAAKISDTLTKKMVENNLLLISQANREMLIQEAQFVTSDLSNADKVFQIGKLFNINVMLFLKVYSQDNILYSAIDAVLVETGVVLFNTSIDFKDVSSSQQTMKLLLPDKLKIRLNSHLSLLAPFPESPELAIWPNTDFSTYYFTFALGLGIDYVFSNNWLISAQIDGGMLYPSKEHSEEDFLLTIDNNSFIPLTLTINGGYVFPISTLLNLPVFAGILINYHYNNLYSTTYQDKNLPVHIGLNVGTEIEYSISNNFGFYLGLTYLIYFPEFYEPLPEYSGPTLVYIPQNLWISAGFKFIF